MTHEYLLKKYGATLTFQQASTEIGLYWQTIREMCQRGDIKAIKAGRKWILTAKALAEYLDNEKAKETQVVVQIPRRTKFEKIV
jgi:excisionase family DNA binding protein